MPRDKSDKKAKKEVKVVDSKPPKADSKKTAKEKAKAPVVSAKELLANGAAKKGKGKTVEAAKPPPPPKDSSEESSEEDSSSDEVETKKANGKIPPTKAKPSSDDSSDSDSSSEDEKPKASQVKPAKPVVKPASSSSSSESSSSEDDSTVKPAPKSVPKPSPAKAAAAAPKGAIPAPKAVASSDSDSDSDSDSSNSSDSDSSDEEPAKPAAVKTSPQKAKASESSSDSEDPGAEGSGEDADMADATSTHVMPKGKRKAENDVSAPAKKVKVAESAGEADSGEIKTLFVGQLSWNVDNDWLASEFAEAGEVVSARVQMDRQSGRSRGFGYVEFATAAAAQGALENLQGKEIDGRAVKLDLSAPRQPNPVARAKQFGDVAGEPSPTLFVGNISWNTTEDMLWEHFGQYGQVSSVRIPTDRETGKPKGFGYVEYSDVESAKKGFEGASGSEIDGRNIRLDYSQPRDSSNGGGGRGGFGGGGFGGRGRGSDRGGRGGGRGFGDRGGRGGGRGRGGDRGGRGGGRGAPRGGARTGGITSFEGRKKTFD